MQKRNLNKHELEIDPAGELIIGSEYNVVKIEETPSFINNCKCVDISDIKTIKKIEKMARSSLEYRRYFQYLKHNLDMSRCTYLPNIASGVGDIRIELHHSPFTMFDVTRIVCNKHIMEHGYAEEFEVSEEIMRLHYENLIGLIPLSPTVHEMVHTESMDVHPHLTYGYWKEFIRLYNEYFTEDLHSKCVDLKAWDNVPTNRVPQLLDVKYTLLQYDGIPMYKSLSLEDHSGIQSELVLD